MEVHRDQVMTLADVSYHGRFIFEKGGSGGARAVLLLLNVDTERVDRVLQFARVPPQHLTHTHTHAHAHEHTRTHARTHTHSIFGTYPVNMAW